jgi:glutamyl-tRNA synthetase/glutamyl-Q tRNA(Asp) synthetase
VDVAALAARLPARPRTRFAPAPTGFLHLGHVLNAVYVWGLAAALGGRVRLRVEDHDRQRCRPEYETALLDDLDWLGLAADECPTHAFRGGPCEGRQSDRDAVYRAAIMRLAAAGLVYGCRCTRRDVETAAGGTAREELRYAGTCRALGLPLEEGLGWRLRVAPLGIAFADAVRGPAVQDPSAQCGDLLLRDRLGNWTYQFAVAVDDTAQGVDLVVRGADLFASTGRQILLARWLGRATPPVFAHHGLIMKSPGQKLSKRDGDTGVRDLRAAGWTAERVLGEAACRAGLLATPREVAVAELPTLVNLPEDETDRQG